MRQRKINPSEDSRTDTLLGPGVYVTGLPPATKDAYLYRNNWDGVEATGRIEAYIRIPASRISKHVTCHHSRNVCVINNENKPLKLPRGSSWRLRYPQQNENENTYDVHSDLSEEGAFYHRGDAAERRRGGGGGGSVLNLGTDPDS